MVEVEVKAHLLCMYVKKDQKKGGATCAAPP